LSCGIVGAYGAPITCGVGGKQYILLYQPSAIVAVFGL
jgi:hypothetical protein